MTQAYATMNFFERQHEARLKTFLILLYLPIALAFICCMFTILIMGIIWCMSFEDSQPLDFAEWGSFIFISVSACVLLLVGLTTLYNAIKLLWGGGKAVAAMFGATQVARDSSDPDERKLLNVVDEMAIASGAPVPDVYVIRNEDGINAFAAGLSMEHSVIVVTHGCMTSLSRDELQGVIAHEFSHILNGDVRLNIYLMALVSGLLVFALIGSSIMQADNIGVSIAGAIAAAIGGLGVLCALLIQSAVSRQREFLADASAVQFTRNPSGIAGALIKIANGSSELRSPRTAEASHFFFASGLSFRFFKLLASHPPISERVRRIDPTASGLLDDEAVADGDMSISNIFPDERAAVSLSGKMRVSPKGVVNSVGATQPQHIAYATKIKNDIPEALTIAAVSPYSARALIYCLLIDEDEAIGIRQLKRIGQQDGTAILELTSSLLVENKNLKPEHRLPLVNMAMPSLKGLSQSQYQKFMEVVEFLAQADGETSLFEYMLLGTMKRRLDSQYLKKKRRLGNTRKEKATASCRSLLSILSWYGSADPQSAGRSYQMGISALGLAVGEIMPREACGIKMLDGIMTELASTPFDFQARILQACVLCISADMMVTIEEAELLRAVAESLGCPVPPLLPEIMPVIIEEAN